MEMFTDEIKRCLIAVAKKIEKEEEKPNFRESPVWQKLRKDQDALYEKLKEKLEMNK